MKNILILYDCNNNGKTGKDYNNINCIFKYGSNERICLFDLVIKKGC